MDWNFLFGWFKVVVLDLTLAGDNAVVIAMAARRLPPRQQRIGIALGAVGAVIIRVILTFAAVELLHFPIVKLIGGALLIWIAINLLRPDNGEDAKIHQGGSLIAAIRIIIIADLVMSTDNILAIAAASAGKPLLVIFGLGLSIPIVVAGAVFVAALMSRYRWIVYLGAAILGLVAGRMLVENDYTQSMVGRVPPILEWAVRIGLAIILVIIGVAQAGSSEGNAKNRIHD